MWNIGDTVKVMSKTECEGIKKKLIPIGTICVIVEVCQEKDGSPYYGLVKGTVVPGHFVIVDGYYLETELERGHLEWIKD